MFKFYMNAMLRKISLAITVLISFSSTAMAEKTVFYKSLDDYSVQEQSSERFQKEHSYMSEYECLQNIKKLNLKDNLSRLIKTLQTKPFHEFEKQHAKQIKVPNDVFIGVYCGYDNTEHAVVSLYNDNLFRIYKVMSSSKYHKDPLYTQNLIELSKRLNPNDKKWYFTTN